MIPNIDIAGVRRREAPAVEQAAGEIRAAFETYGFCYITGHGVPEAVLADAYREALNFFRRPLEEKLRVAPVEAVRGFNAIGRTQMRGATHPDYKEYFQMGLELPRDDPAVLAGQPLRGPNQWPEEPAGFQPAMRAYFDAIAACGRDFLRAVARSLEADPDFFADKYEKPLQRTQAVYYPPHPAEADTELFGVAPHTDYGCVTLLWQDDRGGLEVQDRRQGWIAAPPIPGALVVNIGDLLARWTNDRYCSTPHRVVNRSGRERLSIATFFDPDYAAPVDPAHFGATRSNYAPTTAGDYIIGRINASQTACKPDQKG